MRSSFSTILLLYHVLSIWNFLILTCTIYILAPQLVQDRQQSLPSRECGLKCQDFLLHTKMEWVTPLAGVWIEIIHSNSNTSNPASLPSRECGLKFFSAGTNKQPNQVTPLAGVWIEMFLDRFESNRDWSLPSRECGLKSFCTHWRCTERSHSPRGSVD